MATRAASTAGTRQATEITPASSSSGVAGSSAVAGPPLVNDDEIRAAMLPRCEPLVEVHGRSWPACWRRTVHGVVCRCRRGVADNGAAELAVGHAAARPCAVAILGGGHRVRPFQGVPSYWNHRALASMPCDHLDLNTTAISDR